MSGLVPCKFFSRGSCRYGDSCKFYHNRGDNSGGAFFSNSILAPASFRPQQPGQLSHPQQYNNRQGQGFSNKTAETLAQLEDATVKDMKEWGISKMWPLSVYAPISSKACLPGFEDYSPEELRLSWLEHGRQPPPDLTTRLQRVNDLWMLYQQPNQNTRAMLDRLIKGASTEQIAAEFNISSTSQWGGQIANNPMQATNNMFSQGLQNQTGFPLNSTTPGSGGLWSQPQQPQVQFPLVSQPAINSGLFNFASGGGDTMDASELSAFSQQNALQSSTMAPSFISPQTMTQLAQPPQQKSPFFFSLDANNSPSTNSAPGIGSGTPFAPSIFTQGMPQQQPQQTSIFGGTAPADVTRNQAFGGNPIQQLTGKFVYSEESDLTEEEKASFLAPTFDVIPLKPPPKSCCF